MRALSAFIATLGLILAGLPAAASAAPGPSWHAMLADMAATSGAAPEVRLNSTTGQARFLRLDRPLAPFSLAPESDFTAREQSAQDFLAGYGRLFGLSAQAEELLPGRAKAALGGGVFQKFAQTYRGLPVIAGELAVQTDGYGRVATVSGGIAPDLSLSVAPEVEAAAARATALAASARYDRLEAALLSATEPELAVYDPGLLEQSDAPARLVWRITITAGDTLPLRRLVLVDAHSGELVLTFNQVQEALDRSVYDKDNNIASQTLPGTPDELMRVEGQPASGLADVDLAYDYLGLTYDFYYTWHGRDSVDGHGLPLVATTRYCRPTYACPYANAAWTGSQMVFGDGYATALDVVAHELTHGVTENESNLYYYMQSGAINESLSDVWGEAVELNSYNPHYSVAFDERWLMGQHLPIGAIRNMAYPPQFGDPDHMGSELYWCDETDNGGVHTNSGVGNKAFALAVDGGTLNGSFFKPMGFAKMLPVWYRAATCYLVSGSQYENLADALVSSCRDLLGQNGLDEEDAIQLEAIIEATGMQEQPAACPAEQAEICPVGSANDRFLDDLEHGPDNWVVTNATGSISWDRQTEGYAASATHALYAQSCASRTDTSVAMTADVIVPAGGRLHFRHTFGFEHDGTDEYYDGGVVEYSANGGGSWQDAGPYLAENGYNGSISPYWGNPLAGRQAFVGNSHGYISTRLDLSPLAGQSVRFRFRYGDDGFLAVLGWMVDDVRIYTCPAPPVTQFMMLLLE